MTKSVRAHAHADIFLPEGWEGENTSITFSVEVKQEDTEEILSQDNIELKIDDIDEDEDD